MVKCPQAFKEKSFIEALAEAAELGFFLFVLPQIDITPPFCFKRAMYIYIYTHILNRESVVFFCFQRIDYPGLG